MKHLVCVNENEMNYFVIREWHFVAQNSNGNIMTFVNEGQDKNEKLDES